MAQFECDLCGQGFEQRSAFERHRQTSHPPQAPSAADLERAVRGVEFPARRDELVRVARDRRADEVARILAELPHDEYRDAAEIARAFGALRRHEPQPDHQPSQRGGERALESGSAARYARLFDGIDFPVTRSQILRHVRPRADDDEVELLGRFDEGPYQDMAEIMEEFGRVTRAEE